MLPTLLLPLVLYLLVRRVLGLEGPRATRVHLPRLSRRRSLAPAATVTSSRRMSTSPCRHVCCQASRPLQAVPQETAVPMSVLL